MPHKDLRPIIKQLKDRGYTVEPTKSGHFAIRNAEGKLLYAMPGTPGRGRWLQNLRGELRRRGLIN